jgi:hypothetical protein
MHSYFHFLPLSKRCLTHFRLWDKLDQFQESQYSKTSQKLILRNPAGGSSSNSQVWRVISELTVNNRIGRNDDCDRFCKLQAIEDVVVNLRNLNSKIQDQATMVIHIQQN